MLTALNLSASTRLTAWNTNTRHCSMLAGHAQVERPAVWMQAALAYRDLCLAMLILMAGNEFSTILEPAEPPLG
jgi:hypothetical protein